MSMIMVVDDQTGARGSLAKIVREGGFSIQVARSGREAVKKQGRKPASVIIMDMLMTPRDGLTTAHDIRSFDGVVNFIGVTGHRTEFEERPESVLMSEWIDKPVVSARSQSRLIAAVKRASGGCRLTLPSRELTQRIFGARIVTDSSQGGLSELEGVTEHLGQRIRRMFATLAFRAAERGERRVTVTEHNRFEPALARELLNRIPIDVYETPDILKELLKELGDLVNTAGIAGSWGSVKEESSEYVIDVAPPPIKN